MTDRPSKNRAQHSNRFVSTVSDGALAIVAWVILEVLGSRANGGGRHQESHSDGYRMMVNLTEGTQRPIALSRGWALAAGLVAVALIAFVAVMLVAD